MLDIDPRQQTPRTPPGQPPQPAGGGYSQSAPMPPPKPKSEKSVGLKGSVWYFGILAFIVILITGGVWGLSFMKERKISTLSNEINDLDIELNKLKDVEDDALALKSQYQNVSTALDDRLIWTKFIEVLSSDTLKAAKYDSLFVTAEESSISLSGTTDSITNIAKLIVAFEKSENFSSVQLDAFSLPSEESTELTFGITISWKKSIISQRASETEEE